MNLVSDNQLEHQLKKIKKNYKLIGIKSEFEAEGSSLGDIARLRMITSSLNIKLYVKIGGVEALNDIYNCLDLQVDGIIAPMVETKFGLKKFLEIFDRLKLKKNPSLTINIETKSGIDNIKDILKHASGKINNVTIGRTDLSGSYFKKNIVPNSNFILDKIKLVSKMATKYKLKTTVGGSVNAETIRMYSKVKNISKLINKIETRKVMLPTNIFLKKKAALKNALKFEEMYIMQKKEMIDLRLSSEIIRLSKLNTRK